MTFIVTASGDELSVCYPEPEFLTAPTIAWALAQTNRFGGHSKRPYSVAEHSLLVCEIAGRELHIDDVHGLLAALMHDAHEAFCGDVTSPLKPEIAGWSDFENGWLRAVRRTFNLNIASMAYRSEIKQADLIALATERRDLMPRTPTPWGSIDHVQPVDWVRLDNPDRTAATWQDWRDRWLAKYGELRKAMG